MHLKLPTRLTHLKTLHILFAVLLLVAIFANHATAQNKAPYSKEKLLDIIRLNGLSTEETVSYITKRGVDFQLTSVIEREFAAAGARPEVILATRANFRNIGVANGNTFTPNANQPAPFGYSEILDLVKKKIAPNRLETMIATRGVDFKLDGRLANNLRTSGASLRIISKISGGYRRPPARVKAAFYEDLIDQAVEAQKQKDYDKAITLLQQAIALDVQLPTAHQLMGFVQLYGKSDIKAAEKEMRLAIERGGSAAFRVFHDHSSKDSGDSCAGSLFITRGGVTFKADDGKHTFGVEDKNIADVAVNMLVGRLFGGDRAAFHITVRDERKNERNYNFAPLTKKTAESRLIETLVKSYK